MPRIANGRKKIDIVKIQDDKRLQVTFSKRRANLFKKASELCTMCGAEIAIVGFTPGNSVYSFGHPCVDRVVDRFLMVNPPQDINISDQLVEVYRKERIRQGNREVSEKQEMLDREIKHREALQAMKRDTASGQHWWEAPIEDLNSPQLKQMEKALEFINERLRREAQRQQMVHGTIFPFSNFGSSLTPTGSSSNARRS
ncbi:agamous-like MADS-box protein AGL62 [Solanum dulcamara]|uniref:agamous-like MADS-box protein AGL62 n=1 Tax=Solanum dulcamara TaxID=45834 RepID=UPI00248639A7|nr:agamous-like MADS-box protein AGL62 [Solanum dulcamara]